jgi:hypothetical protein
MILGFILAVVLAAILALVFLLRWRAATRRSQESSARATAAEAARVEADRNVAYLSEQVAGLERDAAAREDRLARLSRYEGIVDTEARAMDLVRAAEADAERVVADSRRAAQNLAAQADAAVAIAKSRADTLLAQATEESRRASDAASVTRAHAQEEARRVVEQGKQQAKGLTEQANAMLAAAQTRAHAIVADANTKAQEIAGAALTAMQNASQWEQTVRAMKNVVDGYGDRYLVPGRAFIDELAESFGHMEAGQQLKLVRDQIRDTVKRGAAAACDYVEENRRETAIRFVTDAFNGKADSILARVRHDNGGTLQQELRDAFALVNHNGQAFRNARITDAYLALRQDELRWAVVAQELKVEEREEQRRIKEQIREEEKARREYERAMKEAAKEEEIVRRAIEKAEQQLATASEAQKAKYEAQLQDLAGRLREAEARNQRALSMAQQTRRGHVYIISNVGSFGDDVFKIGLTRRLDPHERIRELGDSSVPFDFDVHALIFSEDAPALEHQLHRHFLMSQMNKVNYRKEFFRVDVAHIRAEVEALGLTAHWTMTAAARDYRETLAIEAAIKDNPVAREAWAKRQLLLEFSEDPFASDEGAPAAGPVAATPTAAFVPSLRHPDHGVPVA